jgi:hypothetical protein
MKYLSKGLVFLVHFNLGQVDWLQLQILMLWPIKSNMR